MIAIHGRQASYQPRIDGDGSEMVDCRQTLSNGVFVLEKVPQHECSHVIGLTVNFISTYLSLKVVFCLCRHIFAIKDMIGM
jgi:hypothetical protein